SETSLSITVVSAIGIGSRLEVEWVRGAKYRRIGVAGKQRHARVIALGDHGGRRMPRRPGGGTGWCTDMPAPSDSESGTRAPTVHAPIDPRRHGSERPDTRVKIETRAAIQLCRDKRFRVESREFTGDRKSTRLNSSHVKISYAVICLKKKIL